VHNDFQKNIQASRFNEMIGKQGKTNKSRMLANPKMLQPFIYRLLHNVIVSNVMHY